MVEWGNTDKNDLKLKKWGNFTCGTKLFSERRNHKSRQIFFSLSFFNSEEEYRPLAEGEFMKERPQWKKRILEKLAISSNLESFIKEVSYCFIIQYDNSGYMRRV